MNDSTYLKGILNITVAALLIYFRALLFPLAILLIAIVFDYVAGMAKAWKQKTLCPRKGFEGIVKKLSYGFVIIGGMIIDGVVKVNLVSMGVELDPKYSVIMVTLITWLTINEVISILKNAYYIGARYPKFLMDILIHLKAFTEETQKL